MFGLRTAITQSGLHVHILRVAGKEEKGTLIKLLLSFELTSTSQFETAVYTARIA